MNLKIKKTYNSCYHKLDSKVNMKRLNRDQHYKTELCDVISYIDLINSPQKIKSIVDLGIQGGFIEFHRYRGLQYPGYINKFAYNNYLEYIGLDQSKIVKDNNPNDPAETHGQNLMPNRKLYKIDRKNLKNAGSSLQLEYKLFFPYEEFLKVPGVESIVLDAGIDCGEIITQKLEGLYYPGYILISQYSTWLLKTGLSESTSYNENFFSY